MPKKAKLRPDVAETAFRVMQEATGQAPKTVPPSARAPRERNADAVKRGRKGGKKGGPARALVLSDQQLKKIAKKAARNMVREEERLGYNDFGTVEGTMDTIQDKNGSLQFRVRDTALRQAVICHFREEQLEEAFKTFRKRVEVSGVIRYRRDGTPMSVRAERIERLPGDDELPSIDDVRGILRIIA